MADPRFFTNHGPFQLAELASLTGAVLSSSADPQKKVADVAPLDTATLEQLSFLDNPKYIALFRSSHAGACFVHPKHAAKAPETMALLITEQPYLAYAMAASHFYPAPAAQEGISSKAFVDETATIASGAEIAAGAWIGPNASIGTGTLIGPNAVIGAGVSIGMLCRIGANASLSHCQVGDQVIIHPNVSIGQDGFGFARTSNGAMKVPQLGRVIIGSEVEIGAGTTIDRGAGPDTIIGMGTKIDNLVQIGHNVRIGRFVTIVAQVGVSGSTVLEDGVVIAGQAGVAGHLKVGKGAVIAAKSGVTKDVPAGESYGGFPAIPVMEWRRQAAAIARLTKKKGSQDD